jgi:NAD+ synthase (glutamine-hydrolysing)
VDAVYDSLVAQTAAVLIETGFDEVVLGLSGGVDSALLAVIALDAVQSRGGFSSQVQGIIMPSRWTSKQSLHDAQELVERTGISAQTIDIMPSYRVLTQSLGLDDDTLDVSGDLVSAVSAGDEAQDLSATFENIQARVRGLMLMSLSNENYWLVLAPTNLSELSVGYTTLYGDMIGAFAPLAPLYKTWVYELAHFRNRRAVQAGGQALIPSSILEKEPSAELASGQIDRDTLGSYEQLDALPCAYHGGADLEELISLGFDRSYCTDILSKIERSKFKSRQAPPGAHLNM